MRRYGFRVGTAALGQPREDESPVVLPALSEVEGKDLHLQVLSRSRIRADETVAGRATPWAGWPVSTLDVMVATGLLWDVSEPS